jgi:hypothetical protein
VERRNGDRADGEDARMSRPARRIPTGRRRRCLPGHAGRFGRWASALTVTAVVMASVLAALAYFLSTASATGNAKVDTLSPPTINSATPGADAVSLSWSSVSPPDGTGTVTYDVRRNGVSPGGDCPTPSAPTTATSCTDSGLTAGSYEYTVTARWRSWTATSAIRTVTVASGAATHLVLSAALTTVSAGQADSLTITAKDAAENTVTSYTGSKTLTFTGAGTIGSNNPTVTDSGGTARSFGTPETISFSAGVASVAGTSNGVMKLYRAETAGVVVSDGSISNGSGLSVAVNATAPAKLSFTQQPSNSTGGVAFATQPKVAVQDTYGNTASGDTSGVTLAIETNPGGGSLSCTTNPLAAIAGVASFSGCKIDKAGTGYRLTATDGSLTSATSGTFNVTVGPAAKLAFTQQPAGATAGVAFTTQPKVAVQDAGGNVVTTDASSVTLAITSGTGTAGAALTCTANPLAASSGVATFAGCKIDLAGSGYTLHASDGALTATDSSSFNVATGTTTASATEVTAATTTDTTAGRLTNTPSVTTISGATYLVLIYRQSNLASTETASVSGPLTGVTQVTTKNFATGQYLWAFYGTGNGASGAISSAFNSSGTNTVTTVQLMRLSGNDTGTPVNQSTTASATSASPTATLVSPDSADGELVFLGVAGKVNITLTGFTGFTYLSGSTGSGYAVKPGFKASATASSNLSIGNSKPWGLITLEIQHG